MFAVVIAFVRLRWRLLRGAIRHGGTERFGAIVSLVAAGVVGVGGGAAVLAAGRGGDQPRELAVIFCTTIVLAVLGFGVVAGVAQPIDPRVVAAEPLSDGERAAGLLAASAFGPPGAAAMLIGAGLTLGMARTGPSAPLVAAVVVSWLIALLLIARTATNLLALLVSRYPRAGQLLVGVIGLVFYGLFQFVPALLGGLEPDQRVALADVMRWTPPGQIGQAIAGAADEPIRAVGHGLVGSIWLPLLAVAFVVSTDRLAVAVKLNGGASASDPGLTPVGRALRMACGRGPQGTIAFRSILTRFRTPRSALETFTGAGVGLAAVLVPVAFRDNPGSGAVLVGGAVQLAVLFIAGNSFGTDGPALTHELLAGADADTLVRGKARGIAVVAAPLAALGPVLAAWITGEWRYLVAGFGVGVGSLLAGTGAAVVQSAFVPIAVPESDNPFASGESGKGLLAALLLGVVLAGLAVATVPIALALFWATDRGRAGLVTALGAITVLVGWLVMQTGIRIARRRLHGRDPELVAAVTPAR